MHLLRQIILKLCAFALLSPAFAQHSSHAFEPREFSIHLDIQPEHFKIGSAVLGRLTLTNTSKADIDVFIDKSRDYYPSGFDLHAKDSDGISLAEQGIRISSGSFIVLKPGEKAEYKADVAYRFKFKNPGVYTLHASMDDRDGKEMVASNEIILTVTKD